MAPGLFLVRTEKVTRPAHRTAVFSSTLGSEFDEEVAASLRELAAKNPELYRQIRKAAKADPTLNIKDLVAQSVNDPEVCPPPPPNPYPLPRRQGCIRREGASLECTVRTRSAVDMGRAGAKSAVNTMEVSIKCRDCQRGDSRRFGTFLT